VGEVICVFVFCLAMALPSSKRACVEVVPPVWGEMSGWGEVGLGEALMVSGVARGRIEAAVSSAVAYIH